MKLTVTAQEEVNAKTLCVKAGARYPEDADINGVRDEDGGLMPFFDGDYWCPEIDIDTGIVNNWPIGTTANIHYKVCDDGTYTVKDEDGNVVLERSGYVPNVMCPEGEGFGDYIKMVIDENGKIKNWKPDFEDFTEED